MLSSILETLIENKKVLFIPIVSSRSHKTNEYNLATDGNINRIISKISLCNKIDSTILIPKNSINKQFILSKIETKLIESDCYGLNANETRLNKNWFEFINNHLNLFDYDLMVFEPNIIGSFVFNKYIEKIYWMPVSKTITKLPYFLSEELNELDKFNCDNFTTIVSSINQKLKFTKSFLDNNVFNIKKFVEIEKLETIDFKQQIIFFPFRISDKGYKLDLIISILKEIKKDFIFLYSSPNDSDFNFHGVNNLKVSTDREIYYKILNSSPIVIFLENPDEILHISFLELISFDLKLISINNSIYKNKFSIDENLSNLKEKIIEALNEK